MQQKSLFSVGTKLIVYLFPFYAVFVVKYKNTMQKILFLVLVIFITPVLTLALDKADINTATLLQLQNIIHVGEKTALKIIDGRPFSSVDDLIKVKGIGEKTLQKIKEQGLACVSCEQETQAKSEALNQKSEIPTKSRTLDKVGANSNSQNSNFQNTTPIVYPTGVFINEILPNPEGPDETNEWIELYNSNNFDVNLSDWKIRDVKGSVKTYTIPAGAKILANGFLVLKRPDTKIVLNNGEDGLELINPNGKIIDSVIYKEARLGQSYNKTDSGWEWSSSLTPNSENIIPENLPKKEKSDKNNIAEAGLAGISQSPKNTNPWFLFFTALTITIISASAVLFIKFKLKKNQ